MTCWLDTTKAAGIGPLGAQTRVLSACIRKFYLFLIVRKQAYGERFPEDRPAVDTLWSQASCWEAVGRVNQWLDFCECFALLSKVGKPVPAMNWDFCLDNLMYLGKSVGTVGCTLSFGFHNVSSGPRFLQVSSTLVWHMLLNMFSLWNCKHFGGSTTIDAKMLSVSGCFKSHWRCPPHRQVTPDVEGSKAHVLLVCVICPGQETGKSHCDQLLLGHSNWTGNHERYKNAWNKVDAASSLPWPVTKQCLGRGALVIKPLKSDRQLKLLLIISLELSWFKMVNVFSQLWQC